jgi:hypothetical protein
LHLESSSFCDLRVSAVGNLTVLFYKTTMPLGYFRK